ncbi:malto-oligosyltrehalose trehalohydrolase [Streptomyces caatingaensis]|uniref:Malto-oligosyltrehalose trehalohydrolase n=1 Tax=Streptomyces caatingaensis TaxID=1678637 RepID=A0A0K9XJ18_9ACTN|nr:malto-oligosyltrehalose trehalohydrolase [Streptomyces caatingaensis]KNB53360.1 malto-oligosyltrehalose trehalohydrolase [Streptomyces caatingaensis]
MRYEVWAPSASRVTLHADGRTYPMDGAGGGWWRCSAPGADGTRYGFAPDDGPVLPDPRARRLPDGPDGPAAVVDPSRFAWRHDWPGRPLPGTVLYELHVGTFTRPGTFDAAIEHLPSVAGLGVTHVELMPVCPFPGTHGWGYDGVAPWAVHEPYGGPAGLVRFVDAAHALGLGVVLDVVHNHLGPSGNHLPAFGPYFTEAHHTPWGAAVNLEDPEVRSYFTGSALAWLRDYRLDGLRLDAVHALPPGTPFLAELSASVDALSESLSRPLFLIAESDLNDPLTTTPRSAGGHGLHAQWNDDFHHALHTALTGESQGYYADFAADPALALTKTLRAGFFHDGTYSSFRARRHGRPLDPARTPAHRLLAYAQTHDQIGNRALGDRLSSRLSPGLLACAAAIVLCSPFTPMLFMGEEWGARTPWQYFTDHRDPALAEAVRRGRRREFAAHGWPESAIPEPQDPDTRLRSCLDRSEAGRGPHAELLAWHRTLITLRRTEPSLTSPDWTDTSPAMGPDRCLTFRRGAVLVAANLGATAVELAVPDGSEVLAAWRPVVVEEGVLRLPAECAAVIRNLPGDGHRAKR